MKNNYKIENEVATIEINSKGQTLEMLIDKEDFHIFSELDRRICLAIKGYARAFINGKAEFVHRLILDCPKGVYVEHLNGNKLDNRKENLKLVSRKGKQSNNGKKHKSGDKTVLIEITSQELTQSVTMHRDDLKFIPELGIYAFYNSRNKKAKALHKALLVAFKVDK